MNRDEYMEANICVLDEINSIFCGVLLILSCEGFLLIINDSDHDWVDAHQLIR